MTYIIDIILSLGIRGAIAIAILNMTIALQGKLSEKTAQANVFTLTNTVSRIMGDEMKMVGLNVPSTPYFSVVTPDSIEFTYVNPTTGLQIWVKYLLGDPLELASTPNGFDRKIYRCAGSSPGVAPRVLVATGAVALQFAYFNQGGNTTSSPSAVKSFSVHLVMATGEAVHDVFPAAEWTYRFFPSNIN